MQGQLPAQGIAVNERKERLWRDKIAIIERWSKNNVELVNELIAKLDRCPDELSRNALFRMLRKTEQSAITLERHKREVDAHVPVGTLCRSTDHDDGWFEFNVVDNRSSMGAVHNGFAFVIGQGEHGSTKRYVQLIPPWQNREGTTVIFATVDSSQLEAVPGDDEP